MPRRAIRRSERGIGAGVVVAMTRSIPLFAVALLAACQRAPQSGGNSQGPATESGYIAKVKALAPGQRDGVLFRAIQGGGGASCQGVGQTEMLPDTKAGQPVWRVTCTDSSQWIIALADDGTATVTGARDQPRTVP